MAIYAKDGINYALCFHVGATVMYYNMDIMKAAGVNIDKIDTWDDYVKAGQQVVAKTGKPMTTLEITDQWSFWPLIAQQKSDYFDKNGNVWLDNPTNIKTLQFMQDMMYKYEDRGRRTRRVPPRRAVLGRDERGRLRLHLDADVVHGPVHRLHAGPRGQDRHPADAPLDQGRLPLRRHGRHGNRGAEAVPEHRPRQEVPLLRQGLEAGQHHDLADPRVRPHPLGRVETIRP